jgi:hypothetical protein
MRAANNLCGVAAQARGRTACITVLLAVGLPVAVVAIARATATLRPEAQSIASGILLAGFFALCIKNEVVSRLLVCEGLRQLGMATALFTSFAFAFRAPASTMTASSIVGLLFLASVEEVGFRVLMPVQLVRALRAFLSPDGSRLTAVLLSQGSFTLCHFLPGASRAGSFVWIEATRLFVSGILYWIVVDVVGVWFAIGLHASVNFDVLRAATGWSNITLEVSMVVGALSVIALWAHSASSAPQTRGAQTFNPNAGEFL